MEERSRRNREGSSAQGSECGNTSGYYPQHQAKSLCSYQQRHILHGLLAVPGRLQERLHGCLQGSLGLEKTPLQNIDLLRGSSYLCLVSKVFLCFVLYINTSQNMSRYLIKKIPKTDYKVKLCISRVLKAFVLVSFQFPSQ